MNLRCFISINLPVSVRNEIEKTVASTGSSIKGIKWVPAENLHVTLKFLGSISEDSLTDIKDKLIYVCKNEYAFNFRLSGLGMFPDSRRPRIIWIGIIDNGEMKKLQEKVDDLMATIGFKKENRPFSTHLTIGRVREVGDMTGLTNLADTLKNKEFGNIEAGKISIMKSELKPAGAQHSLIAEFNLKRRDNE